MGHESWFGGGALLFEPCWGVLTKVKPGLGLREVELKFRQEHIHNLISHHKQKKREQIVGVFFGGTPLRRGGVQVHCLLLLLLCCCCYYYHYYYHHYYYYLLLLFLFYVFIDKSLTYKSFTSNFTIKIT